MKKEMKIVLIGLSCLTFLSGCGLDSIIMNHKDTSVKQDEEVTSDNGESNVYVSNDESIQIDLPNENWLNTADTDRKRNFVGTNEGMITVEHLTDSFAEAKEVPEDEYDLDNYIEDINASVTDNESGIELEYEVLDSDFKDTEYAQTYYFEIAITSANQVRYEVVYGMKSDVEVYEIVGKSYVDDTVIQSEIKASVDSVKVTETGYRGIIPTTETVSADGGNVDIYICIQSANIRDAGSSNSNVIGSVEEGDKVTVLSEEGNWLKIRYNGETGYVYKKYFEAK
ncbi:MAG: SH3 domain-containing protein [Lachnospiraceae bacterium]|nr:SH3 domain-containing protein [Lachnospiraceae bacterium]MDD3615763.1 SH3 domain-containing protein [Lachnospiraceae bacterium]